MDINYFVKAYQYKLQYKQNSKRQRESKQFFGIKIMADLVSYVGGSGVARRVSGHLGH